MAICRILNGYRDMAVQIYKCKNNVNCEKKEKLLNINLIFILIWCLNVNVLHGNDRFVKSSQ